jgi:hydroxymethylbilane synthase
LKKIVIGSRGSELALWQTNWYKKQLEDLYPDLQISVEIIKTEGDRILDVALSKIGDKGLFTKAIEEALLVKQIDLAVHSLKDLPTTVPNGLCIAAFSRREDQHDAFISLKYDSIQLLPHGASIATGSLRRKSQLLNYRGDLNIIDVRGNINTRLQKLADKKWDGMILALAGVKRLGLTKNLKQTIPEDIILPAVGQGVMAVEIRTDDKELLKMLEPLNNIDSMYQVTAERSMLKTVEGGCQIPVGVYTKITDGVISLDAMIGSVDGKKIVKCSMKDITSNSEELGKRAGLDLLEKGGREILAELRA